MSWRRQIWYALETIDHRGTSKHEAKRKSGHRPGQAVPGVFSDGYLNTVFDRMLTFTHWLGDHYPEVRLFRDLDTSLVTEYLGEKSQVCQPSTVRTILACLRKFEEALWARCWIREAIVPAEWALDPTRVHRGAYATDEAQALTDQVGQGNADYGQALRLIASTGARIDEVFHLRSDKVSSSCRRVELLGKGGKRRQIPVLDGDVLQELDRSRRFVYLQAGNERTWKNGLEDTVRVAADRLGIQRRGVHGFRGTAATKFLRVRMDVLGRTEMEARRELAMWLGHNPHRTEVTYAYVPRRPAG
jgi:integrase